MMEKYILCNKWYFNVNRNLRLFRFHRNTLSLKKHFCTLILWSVKKSIKCTNNINNSWIKIYIQIDLKGGPIKIEIKEIVDTNHKLVWISINASRKKKIFYTYAFNIARVSEICFDSPSCWPCLKTGLSIQISSTKELFSVIIVTFYNNRNCIYR